LTLSQEQFTAIKRAHAGDISGDESTGTESECRHLAVETE
jgi:hypothetical protein